MALFRKNYFILFQSCPYKVKRTVVQIHMAMSIFYNTGFASGSGFVPLFSHAY